MSAKNGKLFVKEVAMDVIITKTDQNKVTKSRHHTPGSTHTKTVRNSSGNVIAFKSNKSCTSTLAFETRSCPFCVHKDYTGNHISKHCKMNTPEALSLLLVCKKCYPGAEFGLVVPVNWP